MGNSCLIRNTYESEAVILTTTLCIAYMLNAPARRLKNPKVQKFIIVH